jgi:hypothetical protein
VADASDVENALVSAITAILYPNGQSTTNSVLGWPCRIFRGFPMPAGLSMDRATGASDIAVYAVDDGARNTTRWLPQTYELPIIATLTVTIDAAESSVTFSGTASAGTQAGLLLQGSPFVYVANGGESADLIAAILADMARAAGNIVWVTGSTVTVPNGQSILGRTYPAAALLQEIGRQEQEFRMTLWSPTPANRDLAASTVMAGLTATNFLPLADGSSGRLRFHSESSSDTLQGAGFFQRDLVYTVDYATTISLVGPVLLFGDTSVNGVNYWV